MAGHIEGNCFSSIFMLSNVYKKSVGLQFSSTEMFFFFFFFVSPPHVLASGLMGSFYFLIDTDCTRSSLAVFAFRVYSYGASKPRMFPVDFAGGVNWKCPITDSPVGMGIGRILRGVNPLYCEGRGRGGGGKCPICTPLPTPMPVGHSDLWFGETARETS